LSNSIFEWPKNRGSLQNIILFIKNRIKITKRKTGHLAKKTYITIKKKIIMYAQWDNKCTKPIKINVLPRQAILKNYNTIKLKTAKVVYFDVSVLKP